MKDVEREGGTRNADRTDKRWMKYTGARRESDINTKRIQKVVLVDRWCVFCLFFGPFSIF
jgi:hypothetical protein